MHKFRSGIAGKRHKLSGYLVGKHLFDAFLPEFRWLSHRDPNIRIEEVAPFYRRASIFCHSDGGSRLLSDSADFIKTSLWRPAFLRSRKSNVHAHFDRANHEGIACVAADIAQEAARDLL